MEEKRTEEKKEESKKQEGASKESDLLEERKKKFIGLFKKYFIFIILLGLLILAWHTRTVNVANLKDVTTGDYTLGPDLDPFLFLRYARYIVDNGRLMSWDYMRYVPLGYNTAKETKLLPYMIAYFHKIISPITQKSINYSAVMFPAVLFMLTVIAFFLFISKIFEDRKYGKVIALISTAFLILSPSLLARTVAGIPEKESAGFLFMFLAFYFFAFAWKTPKTRNALIFGTLAGLSTAIMGLIWGGWIYIFTALSTAVFLAFILGKVNKKEFLVYSSWFIVSIIISLVSTQRFTLKGLIMSTSTGLSFVIFLILLVDFAIFQTKIKEMNFVKKATNKIPKKVFSLIVSFVIILLASVLFLGISFIPNFAKDIVFHLTQPYEDRLSFTVAENRQPYFNEWAGSFGPVVWNIPFFFWLFFIGSIFLFYEFIKGLDKKGRIILISSYILFLLGLIFSRYSSSNTLNGTNALSKFIYFGSFLLIALAMVYVLYIYNKEKKLDILKEVNIPYLFLVAFFIVSLIGARSAIRLIMTLSVPAAGIVGFFVVYALEKINKKDENKRLIAIGLAGLVVISSAYTIYYDYQSTIGSAKSMIPSVYTIQWQNAMAWVRNNTPEDAVFAHWWDYGYWLQSIGNRATVLDGGNTKPYWDYLMGRHALTGQSQTEALEFLYAHNATYFLIDSTDIGKYGAYSNIGSDENYDRYSWIGTFFSSSQNVEERKNETIFFYQGGVGLDEDYNLKDNSTQVFFPSGKTGIGALLISISKDANASINQPQSIWVYNNKQYAIPLRYAYYKNKLYDFGSGYGGCAYIMPKITSSGQQVSVDDKGAAFFLSERNMRALWVRLFLLGESGNFELVHDEQDYIVAELKRQGAIPDYQDFVFYNDVRGPIKIWKIHYPPDIKFKPEYISEDYPESVRVATQAF